MKRLKTLPLTVLLAASLCAAPAAFAAEVTVPPGDIGDDTVWEGSYRLESIVMVQEGANLTIRAGSEISFPPGTRLFVNGTLTVEGTADRPVRFAALPGKKRPAEGGIVLGGKGGENLFRHSIHSGSDWALRTMGDSVVRIENSRFRDNKVAIEAERRGNLYLKGSLFEKNGVSFTLTGEWHAEIRDCTFRDGGGVKVHQGRDIVIAGSTFHGLNGAIEAQQVIGMKIEGNTFEGGEAGVLSGRFSDFTIRCNTFSGIGKAVVIRMVSQAELANNRFTGNGTAVTMNNRGGGRILANDFRDNGTAVFLDLSSYPVITGNAFTGNTLAIDLGRFMSADWEDRHGSKKMSRDVAAFVGSRHLDKVGEAVRNEGVVDARSNWWGETTTAEMERRGDGADLDVIDDWFDLEETTYKGYGDERFRIDRVLYFPWTKERDPDIGPGSGRCLSPRPDRAE